MSYRNGNYCAFYVDVPFSEGSLGAYATPDFCYYQTLRMWKGEDASFPFNDSHEKNYNVRDESSWEFTLKPRLRDRLRKSKNILLFLSSHTRASRALTEEIEYGICSQGLPVIVVYPEFDPITAGGNLSYSATNLWDGLPAFKENIDLVPSLHIPMKKEAVRSGLRNTDFMVQYKVNPGYYRL